MPKSAVVDASVLVSAFLFPLSRPGAVLALAEDGAYTLCLSPILIEETRRSLVNPRLRGRYGRDAGEIDAFCRRLADHAAMVTDLPEIGPVCRDPDDDHVIAAALAAGAGFIVTGDKDLLTLGTHAGIRIVSAADFLDDIMRSS
jgi:putative PIN family toxin of toxin-antitoxin system